MHAKITDLNPTAKKRNEELRIENFLLKGICLTLFTGFIILVVVFVINTFYTTKSIKRDVKDIKKKTRSVT